jgi:hypothetical protein
MSNTTVETEKLDYSEGEQCMRELYNDRNVVSKTWADFLALPKIPGYENNVKRVPNDFLENVIDKIGDPYRTLDDCLLPKKVE